MKTQFRMMAVLVAALTSATVMAADTETVLNSDAGTRATGGVVNFKGSITDASCNVDTNSANQTVDLGKWATNYFKGTGSETQKAPFHIKVQDCPSSITKVAVLFEGEPDATDPSLLAIQGDATGVGIQIFEDDQSSKVKLGEVTKDHDVDGSDDEKGTADLMFYANYRATAETVGAGDASSSANFDMIYN